MRKICNISDFICTRSVDLHFIFAYIGLNPYYIVYSRVNRTKSALYIRAHAALVVRCRNSSSRAASLSSSPFAPCFALVAPRQPRLVLEPCIYRFFGVKTRAPEHQPPREGAEHCLVVGGTRRAVFAPSWVIFGFGVHVRRDVRHDTEEEEEILAFLPIDQRRFARGLPTAPRVRRRQRLFPLGGPVNARADLFGSISSSALFWFWRRHFRPARLLLAALCGYWGWPQLRLPTGLALLVMCLVVFVIAATAAMVMDMTAMAMVVVPVAPLPLLLQPRRASPLQCRLGWRRRLRVGGDVALDLFQYQH